MAYGNLPGGGFSGFQEKVKPIKLKVPQVKDKSRLLRSLFGKFVSVLPEEGTEELSEGKEHLADVYKRLRRQEDGKTVPFCKRKQTEEKISSTESISETSLTSTTSESSGESESESIETEKEREGTTEDSEETKESVEEFEEETEGISGESEEESEGIADESEEETEGIARESEEESEGVADESEEETEGIAEESEEERDGTTEEKSDIAETASLLPAKRKVMGEKFDKRDKSMKKTDIGKKEDESDGTTEEESDIAETSSLLPAKREVVGEKFDKRDKSMSITDIGKKEDESDGTTEEESDIAETASLLPAKRKVVGKKFDKRDKSTSKTDIGKKEYESDGTTEEKSDIAETASLLPAKRKVVGKKFDRRDKSMSKTDIGKKEDERKRYSKERMLERVSAQKRKKSEVLIKISDTEVESGEEEDESEEPKKSESEESAEEEEKLESEPETDVTRSTEDIKVEIKEPGIDMKRKKVFKHFLDRFSPCCALLLYSKRTEFRALKAMLGFPIGVLFGFALYKIVLERLQLSPFASQTLGTILALFLGVGYALSTQVRCICCLTIPSFCGRTGRAYVNTFVITFIIIGPISNILYNAHESVRVLSCIASLNLNHTVERFRLMFKPVKEIVLDFVGAGDKMQEDTSIIKDTYKSIDEEVRDEEEVKIAEAEIEKLDEEIGGESRVDIVKEKFSQAKKKFGGESERKYGMKSELRCEGIFTKGVKGCYESFGEAYDRCHSKLPIIGYLLCWPMKLTFICDLASSFMGKRTCDSSDSMNPGFGESIDTADAVQSEFDKDFRVQLQYKLEVPVEAVDQICPQDIRGEVEHQFSKRRAAFEFFMNMINRILAFMFLQVFNVSRKYCNSYLRTIQFDNKYITSYFRHIDARRHKKGKKVILPLKKSEKLEMSDPFAVKFSAEEKMFFVFNTLRLFSQLLTVSIILMFDRIFYEFLMLIQRHAHVTYKQTGLHHIKMTIYGDGFVGNMVRSVLKGFDKKHETDQVTNTGECLPLPRKLDRSAVIELYVVFLLMFFLLAIESYALRLRRVICAFFYPKREKKRVLFLYNDRLKKRKSFLKYMRHRIRKLAREQAIAIDTGVFFALRHMYPKYFGWLEKLGLGKKKCLICEEIESKKLNFVTCSDECPFAYCLECWQDMREKCYVCLPDDDEDSPLTDDVPLSDGEGKDEL